jgi:hypothetical protein
MDPPERRVQIVGPGRTVSLRVRVLTVRAERVRPPCDHHLVPRRPRTARSERHRAPRPGGTTTNKQPTPTTIARARSFAGESATEAARLLLTGLGLVEILRSYTEVSDPEAPVIGVPDVSGLVAALQQDADAALAAADRTAAIAGSAEFGEPVDGSALSAASGAAAEASLAVATTVRAIATIVLGATSQQAASDAVHLHEHTACVAVSDASEGERVGDAAIPVTIGTRAELLTEVAGVCCRLLLEEADDDHSFYSWELPNGSYLSLEGDTRGLCVVAQAKDDSDRLDAGTEAVLLHVGWPEGSFHGEPLTASTAWYLDEDGVVVAEVATLIVGTLVDVFGGDPAELTRLVSVVPADTL